MTIAPKDAPLDVVIVGDKLVISIGLNCLANAIEWGPNLSKYDEAAADYRYPKVTDPDVFAKEVAIALECESDDGTTMVHRMLDAAALEAIEQGAEGVEVP